MKIKVRADLIHFAYYYIHLYTYLRSNSENIELYGKFMTHFFYLYWKISKNVFTFESLIFHV